MSLPLFPSRQRAAGALEYAALLGLVGSLSVFGALQLSTATVNTLGASKVAATFNNSPTPTPPAAPVNRPPVANDDVASLQEDGTASVDVLANDTDPDGDALTVLSTVADRGSVSIAPSGVLSYTPPANFFGQDRVSYTVADPSGAEATASVSLSVLAVNDKPTAANDASSTAYRSPVSFNVLANDTDTDGDALTVKAVSVGASTGTASVGLGGVLTFTPAKWFSGLASVVYTVADPSGATASATWAVSVAPLDPSSVYTLDTLDAFTAHGADAETSFDADATTKAAFTAENGGTLGDVRARLVLNDFGTTATRVNDTLRIVGGAGETGGLDLLFATNVYGLSFVVESATAPTVYAYASATAVPTTVSAVSSGVWKVSVARSALLSEVFLQAKKGSALVVRSPFNAFWQP